MSRRGVSSAPNGCWAFFLRREYGRQPRTFAVNDVGRRVVSIATSHDGGATRDAVCRQRASGRRVAFLQHSRWPLHFPAGAAGVGYIFPAAKLLTSSLLAAPRLHGPKARVVARLFPGRTSFLEQIPNQMHGWPPPIVAKRWRRRVNLNVGGSPSSNPFSRVQT
jgi:hypothetical protein